jgi:ketosteroid isomerase-like protein
VSEENVEIVRHLYASLNRGDIDAVLDLLDPHVEWWARGDNPETQVVKGYEGIKRFWAEITDVLEELQIEPTEIIDAGEYVVAAVIQVARTRGATTEQREVHVGKFREGKVIEMREFHEMAEALEAAGLKD